MKRHQNNRALSAAFTLFLFLSLCCLAASGPKAKTLYERGQAAETKDDPITAYEDYYQAFQKEPKNLRYKTAYERLRFQAGSAHVERGEKLLAQVRRAPDGLKILLLQESAQDVDFAFFETNYLIRGALADDRFSNAADIGRALLL